MAEGYRIVEVDALPMVSVRVTAPRDQIGAKVGELLPVAFSAAMEGGALPFGVPFSLYHAYGDEVDMEVGTPISGEADVGPHARVGELPEGRAAVAVHLGPYEELPGAWEALHAALARDGLTATTCWERYHTDPRIERNPRRWRTELVALLG